LIVLTDHTTLGRSTVANMADENGTDETTMVKETTVLEEPVEKITWKEYFLGSPDKYNYW
jgi:hypothetical protein